MGFQDSEDFNDRKREEEQLEKIICRRKTTRK